MKKKNPRYTIRSQSQRRVRRPALEISVSLFMEELALLGGLAMLHLWGRW